MTPIEKAKADAAAKQAAHKAISAMLDELLETMLERMPDGATKRNGQILQLSGRITRGLEALEAHAASVCGKPFDEKQSQQVLDYLSCVHVGMTEFVKQIGLEVSDGTP